MCFKKSEGALYFDANHWKNKQLWRYLVNENMLCCYWNDRFLVLFGLFIALFKLTFKDNTSKPSMALFNLQSICNI